MRLLRIKLLGAKMDLNSFIGNNERQIYKITFILSESKITRFISASSKDNAKYLLEQEIKKENSGDKFKVLDIKELTNKPVEVI